MAAFRHAIGKSTLAEGLTVPRTWENWINAPPPGEKREITLLFEDQRVHATLRRLANAREHVQIKYENKQARPFREWLGQVFVVSREKVQGEYLEFARVDGDVYRIIPFPVSCQPSARLEISEWIFHRSDERVFQRIGSVREIPAIIGNVEFKTDEGQTFYNRQLAKQFADWSWESERRVVPELPLKSDFLKGRVQVEVEFGNARSYYQDYVKFMLASRYKTAEFGILVVPTERFARSLCEVGRKRAEAKGRHSYSGMIHLEKVRRELEFLKFMLPTPFAIAGIGAKERG